jgi:hypothetical protein
MLPIIILVALVIGGCFVYMKFFAGKAVANAHAAYNLALQTFEADEASFLNRYWNDENCFKLFKTVVADEAIVGIMSCDVHTKTLHRIGESIKSAITNTNTFDMNLYYLVATEKHLHFVGFDGKNSIVHDVFSIADIKSPTLKVETQKLTLTFTVQAQAYAFDLQGSFLGLPKFEVVEDFGKHMLRTQNDRNFNPYKRKYFKNDSAEDSIDFIVRHKYSKAFVMKLQIAFGIRFPDVYQY